MTLQSPDKRVRFWGCSQSGGYLLTEIAYIGSVIQSPEIVLVKPNSPTKIECIIRLPNELLMQPRGCKGNNLKFEIID